MAVKSSSDTSYKTLLKEIRKIVREEVGNEIQASKDDLDSTIREARMRVQMDIREQADRTKNLEIRVERNHKELKAEIKEDHLNLPST